MPKQDLRAGELEKAQEIADVIFPAGDQSARVVEPGEEAFNLPAATVPAQGPAVLGAAAPRAIRRNHLDAVVVAQLHIEQVAVVAAIADEAGREFAEEAGVEGGRDEVRLIR
jgi:hypothetical protein